MLTTRTLDAAAIEAEGWADRVLALDRENMTHVLGAAGLEFPEQRRRAGLRDPTTALILLLDGETLAGYVEFCRDWRSEQDIHLGSIQLREQYRGGVAFAVLLVECARALRQQPFARLRAGVQKNNRKALELYRKLGFRLSERGGDDAGLDVTGDRDLLESPRLRRLEEAVAEKYSPSHGESV